MKVLYGAASIDDLGSFLDHIETVREETGTVVQAFDPAYVVGERHLQRAAELAARSIVRGANVADDPAVELLLYAAGRRQIDRALEMGVSAGDEAVVCVVLDGTAIETAPDSEQPIDTADERTVDVPEPVFDPDAEPTSSEAEAIAALDSTIDPVDGAWEFDRDGVREFFGIDDRELSATEGEVAAIVLERVALLDVEK